VTEVIDITTHAVSLLDVLLSASTEPAIRQLRVESSFEGQSCLVAGHEAALADALLGLFRNTVRAGKENQWYSARVTATGETVTLTLSEEGGGTQWSLQFPELHP
jgi:hypothetical protein